VLGVTLPLLPTVYQPTREPNLDGLDFTYMDGEEVVLGIHQGAKMEVDRRSEEMAGQAAYEYP